MCKILQFSLEEGGEEIYRTNRSCYQSVLPFFLPVTGILFIQEALGLETELEMTIG